MHTVKFTYDGNTFCRFSDVEVKVRFGETVVPPTSPECNEKYEVFLGWYDKYGEKVDFENLKIYEDMEFHGKSKFIISFRNSQSQYNHIESYNYSNLFKEVYSITHPDRKYIEVVSCEAKVIHGTTYTPYYCRVGLTGKVFWKNQENDWGKRDFELFVLDYYSNDGKDYEIVYGNSDWKKDIISSDEFYSNLPFYYRPYVIEAYQTYLPDTYSHFTFEPETDKHVIKQTLGTENDVFTKRVEVSGKSTSHVNTDTDYFDDKYTIIIDFYDKKYRDYKIVYFYANGKLRLDKIGRE